MEKFALLNLLKALDGLSGKKPENENGANAMRPDENGNGFDAGNALGGILGNLLKNGFLNGNAVNNKDGQPAPANDGATAPDKELPNVMASVLERHEAMANRVKNKK